MVHLRPGPCLPFDVRFATKATSGWSVCVQAPVIPTGMRRQLSDHEWLFNKPRGVSRVDDRRVLNGGSAPSRRNTARR